MLQMSLDAKAFGADLKRIEQRQIPQAVVWALNDTAGDVLDFMQRRMEVTFDRPTRFTKNAFQVWRATKSKREAKVQERPSVSKRHYLKTQEGGGGRGMTGLEKALASRLTYDGVIRSVIPAEGAKLDGFGNWSAGERNQVLSQLGAQRDAASNTTAASAKRSKGKRARYFVPRHGLAPGVYKRTGADDIPIRVLKFSDAVPRYRERLGFYDGAGEVFRQRIGENLARAIEKAIATAR